MDGSRRVLSRYGPPCLFTGHLSTKSNAFCTDSSSLRLSTLELVKNHMTAHYNKILSAKAAIDCSVPLSVSTSIKYADQQRREKLKKELARCEKEFRLARMTMQANSKMKSKSLLNSLLKPSGEPEEASDVIEEFPSFTRSPELSSERFFLGPSKPRKAFVNGTAKTSSSSLSSMEDTASRARRASTRTPRGRAPKSSFPHPHQNPLASSKASSGDLLDKHSELFSNKPLPFTPRTLKTDAKSFLSQYRYYTPAKRKKNPPAEAETQTELSSFTSDCQKAETENLTDSEVNTKQTVSCLTLGTKDKVTPSPSQESSTAWDEHSSSSDEELLYLSFIEDITDEILKLGLFSNRFIEQLFERHINENKHHLEEGRMRHLLHVLKVNLGFSSDETSDVYKLSFCDFEKTEKGQQNEFKHAHELTIQQERLEYQKALDMLMLAQKDENEMWSSPSDFFMPVSKTKQRSGEVVIQQVHDEASTEPSWDKTPQVPESITQKVSVEVIEGNSDTEKDETLSELACPSPPLSQAVCSPGTQVTIIMM